MELWVAIVSIIGELLVGLIVGFFVARTWFKNYLKKNSKVIYVEGYEKEKSIDNIDERLDFEKALNKLETNIKSIIILKCYLNFTFDEISIILDKPTGTIKTWYYKGLDKLKAIIDAQEGVTNYE